MNAPQKVDLVVTPAKDIMAITHWADGSRSLDWHGPWSALRLIWRLIRAGIKVEVVD